MTFDIVSANNTGTRCMRFIHSKRALFYNVVLLLIFVTTQVYSIPYFYRLADRVKLERLWDSLQNIIASFAAAFILMKFCFSSDKLISITNRIIRITESLLSFKSQNENTNKLSLEIGIIFLINITIWTLIFATAAINDITFIPYDLIAYFSTFVINALMIQYCVILKFIEHDFKMINENLLEYSRQESFKIRLSIDLRTKVDGLLQLRKLHASISEVSRDVSSFYSYSMLLCILHLFFTLILTCYYFAKPMVGLYEDKLTDTVFIHCFLYGFLFVVLVATLTKCVTAAIEESKRTKEIINAGLIIFDNDEKMKNKLNQFSTYLVHTDLTFTVSRLFALDESLLTSMVGSITTYMVIMLQFQQSNKPTTSITNCTEEEDNYL